MASHKCPLYITSLSLPQLGVRADPGCSSFPPDSHLMAAGSAQALSFHLQGTNPAPRSLGWLLASCEQEGREEAESQGEALLSLQPPEQLHQPCCHPLSPSRLAPWPQMSLAQGDSRPPPLCPHGDAKHRELRGRTAEVTHSLPMSSHSLPLLGLAVSLAQQVLDPDTPWAPGTKVDLAGPVGAMAGATVGSSVCAVQSVMLRLGPMSLAAASLGQGR